MKKPRCDVARYCAVFSSYLLQCLVLSRAKQVKENKSERVCTVKEDAPKTRLASLKCL